MGCGCGSDKKIAQSDDGFECRKGAPAEECCVTGDGSACDCSDEQESSGSCGCQ